MKTYKISEPISFAVALIVAIGAIAITLRFPDAGDAPSGPGSFPLFLGIIMAGLSICGIFLSLGKREQETLDSETRLERSLALPRFAFSDVINGRANLLMSREKQMLTLGCATALYLLVMPLLGFISGTAIFCMATLMILGYRNPVRALAAGFITAFTLYGIFGILMNVVLPKGWIG